MIMRKIMGVISYILSGILIFGWFVSYADNSGGGDSVLIVAVLLGIYARLEFGKLG